MKKTKTRQQKNDYAKVHYHKNRLIISERNKQNRKRKQQIDKFHFYGFWLLLTAVLVDTIINKI
jgi:hypothetical protein